MHGIKVLNFREKKTDSLWCVFRGKINDGHQGILEEMALFQLT